MVNCSWRCVRMLRCRLRKHYVSMGGRNKIWNATSALQATCARAALNCQQAHEFIASLDTYSLADDDASPYKPPPQATLDTKSSMWQVFGLSSLSSDCLHDQLKIIDIPCRAAVKQLLSRLKWNGKDSAAFKIFSLRNLLHLCKVTFNFTTGDNFIASESRSWQLATGNWRAVECNKVVGSSGFEESRLSPSFQNS